jgi:replicative superfamily II helicase
VASKGSKKETAQALALLRLVRSYVIDVIATGQIIAEARLADVIGNELHAHQLRKVQAELHERIQAAEVELVSEIAKHVE